jgi:hypothetical protein
MGSQSPRAIDTSLPLALGHVANINLRQLEKKTK